MINGANPKGNALWHVDNSSKYPRYSYSALLAHEIPEQGGATQVGIQQTLEVTISSPMSGLRTKIYHQRKKMRSKTLSFCIHCGTRGNLLLQVMKPRSTKSQSVQAPNIDWYRLIYWVERSVNDLLPAYS
jgi:hypothetical protein